MSRNLYPPLASQKCDNANHTKYITGIIQKFDCLSLWYETARGCCKKLAATNNIVAILFH